MTASSAPLRPDDTRPAGGCRPRPPATAQCRECGMDIAVRSDGRLCVHRTSDGLVCDGSESAGGCRPRKAQHGTRSRYVLGCRCEPCATANRTYKAAYRERMQDIPFRMVPHGLHGYDTFGCRCDICRAAKHEAYRRRKPTPQRVPDGHKRCSRCKEIKPHDEFYPEKRVPDGRRAECKECHLTDRKAAYWRRKAVAS